MYYVAGTNLAVDLASSMFAGSIVLNANYLAGLTYSWDLWTHMLLLLLVMSSLDDWSILFYIVLIMLSILLHMEAVIPCKDVYLDVEV